MLGRERDREAGPAETGGGREGKTISDGQVCVSVRGVLREGLGGKSEGGTPNIFWYI